MAQPCQQDEVVTQAIDLIDEAKLPHPFGPLISRFVLDALNRRLAAEYFLKRCHDASNLGTGLFDLVTDWKYIVESRELLILVPHYPWLARRA